MIIVDDRLCLDALAGRLASLGPLATTWGFHFRLVRALNDRHRRGVLGAAAASVPPEALRMAADPPASRLRVLDPREVTELAAELAARHGLNLLAAELVAAALRHRAPVRLSPANVGRRWPEVMAAEGVVLEVA